MLRRKVLENDLNFDFELKSEQPYFFSDLGSYLNFYDYLKY